MTERGILFSGSMTRAILSGSKSQTRRVVKPQPIEDRSHDHVDCEDGLFTWWAGNRTFGIQHQARCPYGQPGERLWCRETWAAFDGNAVLYAADRMSRVFPVSWPQFAALHGLHERHGNKWRPSIHMPRWASRILLEIVSVRVERLQDISEDDARAEGIERGKDFPGWYRGPLDGDSAGLAEAGRHFKIPTAFPKLAFRALWESINGPDSWAANPFVWVVEFRRVEATEGER